MVACGQPYPGRFLTSPVSWKWLHYLKMILLATSSDSATLLCIFPNSNPPIIRHGINFDKSRCDSFKSPFLRKNFVQLHFTNKTVKKEASVKSQFQHLYPFYCIWHHEMICTWKFLFLLQFILWLFHFSIVISGLTYINLLLSKDSCLSYRGLNMTLVTCHCWMQYFNSKKHYSAFKHSEMHI